MAWWEAFDRDDLLPAHLPGCLISIKAQVLEQKYRLDTKHSGDAAVDIVIGGTPPVKLEKSEDRTPPNPGKKALRDRRKNKRDRRRSVREGIFVSLSVKHERRSGLDRRKNRS
jgi:hypothetical protein